MSKLPILKPKELISILKKNGFVEYRQKGSHIIMVNEVSGKQTIVPMHNKDLRKGTLAAILRQTEISIDDL